MRPSLVALIFFIAALLGCTDPPPFADGRIEGTVHMIGPVSGGTVRVVQLGPDGTRGQKLLGSGPVAEDGTFAVDASVAHDTVLIEYGGRGVYREIWSDIDVPIEGRAVLTALIPDFVANDKSFAVAITPISTLAENYAFGRLEKGKTAGVRLGEAAARANQIIGSHFGNIDPISTVPAALDEPVESGSQRAHALVVLAGMSQLSQRIALSSNVSAAQVNTLQLTRAWVEDLRGHTPVFDGKNAGTGRLTLGSCERPPECTAMFCDTICSLDANTPRAELALAIRDFVNSPANQTGLTQDDLRVTLNDIRTNTDIELFSSVTQPGFADGDGPVIHFEGAGEAIVTREQRFVLQGVVSDNPSSEASGLDLVKITVNGESVPVELNLHSGAFTATLPLVAAPCDSETWSGTNEVTLSAIDLAKNATDVGFNVLFDNCDPVLEVVAPEVVDERELQIDASDPGEPCFNQPNGRPLPVTVLSPASPGTPLPEVFKYVFRLQAHKDCGTANPGILTWSFRTSDNHAIAFVQSRLIPPVGQPSPWRPLPTVPEDPAHPQLVVNSVIELEGAHPGLLELDGLWRLEIEARDDSGRTQRYTVDWDHHVLPGPLKIEAIFPHRPEGTLFETLAKTGSLDTLKRLLHPGDGQILIEKFSITNPTRRPVWIRGLVNDSFRILVRYRRFDSPVETLSGVGNNACPLGAGPFHPAVPGAACRVVPRDPITFQVQQFQRPLGLEALGWSGTTPAAQCQDCPGAPLWRVPPADADGPGTIDLLFISPPWDFLVLPEEFIAGSADAGAVREALTFVPDLGEISVDIPQPNNEPAKEKKLFGGRWRYGELVKAPPSPDLPGEVLTNMVVRELVSYVETVFLEPSADSKSLEFRVEAANAPDADTYEVPILGTPDAHTVLHHYIEKPPEKPPEE